MAILVCENLTCVYGKNTPFEKNAIKDISLSIESGKIYSIIGQTGSGKSTLIQHFNGLIEPDYGKVLFQDNDIWLKENKTNLKNVRFAIGLCFQYPEYQIFEETVYKEIAFGPRKMQLDETEIKKRVLESMSYLNIPLDYLEKSPFDLSGGEKRRVAIASIIAMKPEVLVLDEPCAGLDPAGRKRILELITNYQKENNNTVIFVSHSMEDVATISDNIFVMNDGKIYLNGSINDVFSHSKELANIGLDVPEITQVFIELNKLGVDCRTDIYTIEQGIKEFEELKTRRKNN